VCPPRNAREEEEETEQQPTEAAGMEERRKGKGDWGCTIDPTQSPPAATLEVGEVIMCSRQHAY
jgi:hypothetical protein